MSDIEPTGRATVLVCITCRTTADFAQLNTVDAAAPEPPRPGLILAEATAAAAANASDISVQRVRCLGLRLLADGHGGVGVPVCPGHRRPGGDAAVTVRTLPRPRRGLRIRPRRRAGSARVPEDRDNSRPGDRGERQVKAGYRW